MIMRLWDAFCRWIGSKLSQFGMSDEDFAGLGAVIESEGRRMGLV